MAEIEPMRDVSEPPPGLLAAAVTFFGPQLDVARRYAESLATDAVIRGLMGPREADRMWERHILNCAAIAPGLPPDAHVIDIGSGAGLPGVVLAIARPDVRVTLVESLGRRTAYLEDVVVALDLVGRIDVVRGRAEDVAENVSMFHVKLGDVVTSRAVAPLDRLAGWCLPLTRIGGRIMAIKGSTATEEVANHSAAVTRLGGSAPIVRAYGVETLPEPTTVVEIVRERIVDLGRTDAVKRGGRDSSRSRSRSPRR
jgi:16S rRNA (guanine527-N7)-methyltransferase